MKKLIALFVAFAFVFNVSANVSVSARQASNDVIRLVYASEVTTLNYLITSTENEYAIAANCIDGLIEFDRYGAVKPSLAESWSTNDDNTEWTFTLREGVKWVTNKGKEYADVKAQDFVDAAKYILNPDNASATSDILCSVIKNAGAYYGGEITDFDEVGVEAVDDYTLVYTLEAPTPYFLSMLTFVCFFPVNGEFLEKADIDFGIDNSMILYNGSYIMSTFEPQSRRVLTANDSYWDKDNVFIKTITYTYNKEATTLGPELFVRGETNQADIPAAILQEWLDDPARAEMVRPSMNGYYSYFYAFNFDPQFDEQYEPENWRIAVNNANFRKAIFYALDRAAAIMTEEPFDPESRKLNTIVPKNFVDFYGLDYTDIGPLKEITERDSYDAELAAEYKEKAMEELEGVATFPIKVLTSYNPTMPDWANRAQVVAQQLERLLGEDFIEVIIEPGPATGFLAAVRRSGNYALLECNWGPDYADPETFTDPFYPGGTYNKPELAEEYLDDDGVAEYAKLVDKARAERVDVLARYEYFAEAEAFLINEAFVIPFMTSNPGYVASYLNPFEGQYSPFGVSYLRYKGQHILEKPMTMDEFKEALEVWESERAEVLADEAELGRNPAEGEEDFTLIIHRPVYTGKKSYNSYPFNEEVKADLNGDGVDEVIIVTVIPGEDEYFSAGVLIKINDLEVEYNDFRNLSEEFAIVDIDTSDEYMEIAISDFGPSDDYFSVFYYYDGDEIIFMNEGCNNDQPRPYYYRDFVMDKIGGLFSEMEFSGKGNIVAVGRAILLQTWWYSINYELTDDHLLKVVPEVFTVDFSVTSLINLALNAEMDPESPVVTMEEGMECRLTALDDIEWVQVTLPDGESGWFKIEDWKIIDAETGEGFEPQEVFHGLMFFD